MVMRVARAWPAVVVAFGLLVHGINTVNATENPASGNAARLNESAQPAGLVERFLTRAEPALTSYRALRTLEAETRGARMRARLTAWTSLDPIEGFQYSIVDEA